MLESVDLDAGYVVMGEEYMTPIAIGCMNAGKHVFIEKPPGSSPEETQQLLDAGVDMFVNLTDDMPGGGDRLSRYDRHVEDLADIVRLPITDLHTPTVDHMVHILDTIDEHLDMLQALRDHDAERFAQIQEHHFSVAWRLIDGWANRNGNALAR